MKNSKQRLHGTQKNDPEWINELAYYCYIFDTPELTDENKKLILKLFLEYRRDGLSPKGALKKAKLVFESFNL